MSIAFRFNETKKKIELLQNGRVIEILAINEIDDLISELSSFKNRNKPNVSLSENTTAITFDDLIENNELDNIQGIEINAYVTPGSKKKVDSSIWIKLKDGDTPSYNQIKWEPKGSFSYEKLKQKGTVSNQDISSLLDKELLDYIKNDDSEFEVWFNDQLIPNDVLLNKRNMITFQLEEDLDQ